MDDELTSDDGESKEELIQPNLEPGLRELIQSQATLEEKEPNVTSKSQTLSSGERLDQKTPADEMREWATALFRDAGLFGGDVDDLADWMASTFTPADVFGIPETGSRSTVEGFPGTIADAMVQAGAAAAESRFGTAAWAQLFSVVGATIADWETRGAGTPEQRIDLLLRIPRPSFPCTPEFSEFLVGVVNFLRSSDPWTLGTSQSMGMLFAWFPQEGDCLLTRALYGEWMLRELAGANFDDAADQGRREWASAIPVAVAGMLIPLLGASSASDGVVAGLTNVLAAAAVTSSNNRISSAQSGFEMMWARYGFYDRNDLAAWADIVASTQDTFDEGWVVDRLGSALGPLASLIYRLSGAVSSADSQQIGQSSSTSVVAELFNAGVAANSLGGGQRCHRIASAERLCQCLGPFVVGGAEQRPRAGVRTRRRGLLFSECVGRG